MRKHAILFLALLASSTCLNAQIVTQTPEQIYHSAIHIDAGEIDDFKQGYAIIRKGEDFAMIDKDGKYFIPYGKYKFNKPRAFQIDSDRCGFSNGMCVVRDPDSEAYGYIDLNGKLVVPCTLKDVTPFMKDGYAWAKHTDSQGREEQVYIDKGGKKYRLKDQALYNHNVLYAYAVAGSDRYSSFYNKKGELLFKTKRWYKGSYSEGLIQVDTTYELAGEKTGFMDLKGNLVIPYKLKVRQMSGFSEGLALYETSSNTSFGYAYIDKTGETVIKVHKSDEFPSPFFHRRSFEYGLAAGSSGNSEVLLNKEGKMIDIKGLILGNNPELLAKLTSFDIFYAAHKEVRQGPYIRFSADMGFKVTAQGVTSGLNGGQRHTYQKDVTNRGMGIADLSGKVMIAPVYQFINFPDPVSGLAKVTYSFSDSDDSKVLIGYASATKILTIVMAPQK